MPASSVVPICRPTNEKTDAIADDPRRYCHELGLDGAVAEASNDRWCEERQRAEWDTIAGLLLSAQPVCLLLDMLTYAR